jgi:hypothetical protein
MAVRAAQLLFESAGAFMLEGIMKSLVDPGASELERSPKAQSSATEN